MTRDAAALFAPFKLGDLALPNRIVMAPLTRNRAAHGTDAPHELNALYYRQRASAGLLISEASQVSQQGQGYIWTPGSYSRAQIEGWRKVTDAVHGAGGRIFVQLWHVGRVSHVALQPGGQSPVAPSIPVSHGLVSGMTRIKPSSAAARCAPDLIAAVSSVHVRPARK